MGFERYWDLLAMTNQYNRLNSTGFVAFGMDLDDLSQDQDVDEEYGNQPKIKKSL